MYKEKFDTLMETWKCDLDAIDIIERTISSFAQYVEAVVQLEACISARKALLSHDKEKYTVAMTNLDRSRKLIHESLISNVKIVNRLSAEKGLPLIYDGGLDSKNSTDRFNVGTFAGEVAKEYFDKRNR